MITAPVETADANDTHDLLHNSILSWILEDDVKSAGNEALGEI